MICPMVPFTVILSDP